jgi:hypothetical protein
MAGRYDNLIPTYIDCLEIPALKPNRTGNRLWNLGIESARLYSMAGQVYDKWISYQ